jgi:AcrR family transcriptional regulator
LVEEGFAALLEEVRTAINRPESVRRRLERLIDAHLEFVRNETDFCRVLLSEGPEYRWRRQLRKIHDQYTETVTTFLREGQAEGVFADVDPDVLLHTTFGAVMGLALDYLVLGDDVPFGPVGEKIKRILFQGILA